MAITLDQSRKVSTVHGQSPRGERFYQDGLPFDAHGDVLPDEKLNDDERAIVAKMKKKPRVVKEKTFAEANKVDNSKGKDGNKPVDDKGVDLTAWVKGEKKYKFFQVSNAIKTRYSVSVTSAAEAKNYLVNDAKIV